MEKFLKTGITYAAKEGFSSNSQDDLKHLLGDVSVIANMKFIGFNFL